jgi:hypothetical protein
MTATDLKLQLKTAHDRHEEPSRVRLHRAISWLARAEQEPDDLDARFIFLWIAFNAAYAKQFGFEQTERDQLQDFINALVQADSTGQLKQAVFQQFSGPIRVLIENKFVFEPFWRALREHDASDAWQKSFGAGKSRAMTALMGNQTQVVLSIVFDRLYVLRNQLVHGGATWNSQVNRPQVSDGARILGTLVPLILGIMIEHPELDFGEILYPVVM